MELDNRIALYLLDDQGICCTEEESGLEIAGFWSGDTREETEYSKYFRIYWIRNPVEIWAWIFLTSKILSVDAKRLNKLLPDILCVDYALKAKATTSTAEYQFAKPVETYIGDANLEANLTEELLGLSPLPGLRKAASEAGLKEIIETTRFDKGKTYSPPTDADYTTVANTIAKEIKPGAIDQMGALGGRLMHLLVANSYGTVCVGHTAHNLNDFKRTELAYSEYLLGESRDDVVFLCTQRSGDQGEKRYARWKPLIEEGVQKFRDQLVNLCATGIIEFNFFELQEILTFLNADKKNYAEFNVQYTEYQDCLKKYRQAHCPNEPEPQLPSLPQKVVFPQDATITIKTNIGERKLPLNGLFIDKSSEDRVWEINNWIQKIMDSIARRYSFTENSWTTKIQLGKALAERLFNSYQNVEFRKDRRELSKLLKVTITTWEETGEGGLPQLICDNPQSRISKNALATYCKQIINSMKGKDEKAKETKEKLLKCLTTTFPNYTDEHLLCITQSCAISDEKDEDVKRWGCFFVYTRLCCERTFLTILGEIKRRKKQVCINRTSIVTNCLLSKEDIFNLPKIIDCFSYFPNLITQEILYDALYPLAKSPLILPFHTEDSISKSWRVPIDLGILVQNGLTEEQTNLFKQGELVFIRNYADIVWEELKNETLKRIDSQV